MTKSKKKQPEELAEQPVTNATLDDHKEEILDKGRIFVRPLGLTRKRIVLITAGLAVALFVAALATLGVLVYHYKSDSELVYQASRIIPYPAARVDGRFITYADYLFELRPLKHYYESPVGPATTTREPINFSTPEGKQQLEELRRIALTEAQKKVVINKLAREQDVKVSRAEVSEAVNEAIQREGGEKKFTEAIDYFYGWELDDFRKVLRTQLLQRKLQPALSGEQRSQAEEVLAKVRAGEDFAKLAKEHSQDPGSKEKGGALDAAPKGTYVTEFEEAAYALETGQVSDVIETQFGFHIIKLIDKKDNEVTVAHILIPYTDLSGIINQRLEEAKTGNYIDIDLKAEPPQPQEPQPQAS